MFAKNLATIVVLCMATSLSACSVSAGHPNQSNSDTKTSKTVPVKEFNGIDVEQGIKVIYTQGKLTPAEISAPASIIDRVKIEQKGKELKIRLKKNSSFQNGSRNVQVRISSTVLREIEVSSGATVEIPGGLTLQSNLEAEASSGASLTIKKVKANRIELEASSAAKATIKNIDAAIVEAEASSSAYIDLSGRCNGFNAEASSGAQIHAKALSAQNGKAEATSGAEIFLNVISLSQESNSGGSVTNVR